MLHWNSASDSSLEMSCNVGSDHISELFYTVRWNFTLNKSFAHVWFHISHLENIRSLIHADLPNNAVLHYGKLKNCICSHHHCFGLNVCVCPQNSYVKILAPKDYGISMWGPWEILRSWGWGPHEWDKCPQVKVYPGLAPSARLGHRRHLTMNQV